MSKGQGLLDMCKLMNIDAREVVAFGDGNNDKEFLEFAGLGVAMKNAGELAKSVAGEITDFTNDEDGVAVHLEILESRGLFV
jgi:5-amino-6-(5-phospho-D-ribitylamino)uracil phosphatase